MIDKEDLDDLTSVVAEVRDELRGIRLALRALAHLELALARTDGDGYLGIEVNAARRCLDGTEQ